MVQVAKHGGGSRRGGRRSSPGVEVTALVSLYPLPDRDMVRIAKMLEGAGISGITPARVTLSRSAVERVAASRLAAGRAGKIAAKTVDDPVEQTQPQTLVRALDAAVARGDTLKQALLADPGMLSTAEMAERLGMSEEGVRLKRKRHEVLGLELAKRGIRYPAWQILEDQKLLPMLPGLFRILGDSPWTIYRFLLQHHAELGGVRALDALQRGRTDAVIATAENVAGGGFS
jgi:hypothetical protein